MRADAEPRLRLVDPQGVERVGEYREAARRLLRSDLTLEGRKTALMRLYRRAKDEPWGDMLVGAIVGEIIWSIERDDVEAIRSGDDRTERAHRSLRSRGYARCPECHCELSREVDWSRWHAAQESAGAEYEAREGAVP